jgi:hypothetical protein
MAGDLVERCNFILVIVDLSFAGVRFPAQRLKTMRAAIAA